MVATPRARTFRSSAGVVVLTLHLSSGTSVSTPAVAQRLVNGFFLAWASALGGIGEDWKVVVEKHMNGLFQAKQAAAALQSGQAREEEGGSGAKASARPPELVQLSSGGLGGSRSIPSRGAAAAVLARLPAGGSFRRIQGVSAATPGVDGYGGRICQDGGRFEWRRRGENRDAGSAGYDS